jgi:hypothetical protein
MAGMQLDKKWPEQQFFSLYQLSDDLLFTGMIGKVFQ